MKLISAMTGAVVICLATMTGATAGSSQAGFKPMPVETVAPFAREVEETLAERGVHVALVGRVGRDRSELPDGIEYTHMGFWVYSDIQAEDGSVRRGYRVYNLYQRGAEPDVSDLVQDGPVDFLSGAVQLEAAIIIPDPKLQKKLISVMSSPDYRKMHNPNYSLLSNPDTNTYQNCTEFTLNVLMAALYGTDDIGRIKTNIRAHFAPQPIRISGFKRVLGPMFMDGVAMDDHGNQVRTATFGTISRFMTQHGLTTEIIRLTPSGTQPLSGGI